ncbi:MAG TPA: hypothetical protein VL588_05250 [Bdellovibrionota bacterium]|jgi:hypothetical protein|nr:hypothetical protein [Bdellovibrionota bacterium]
MAGKKGEAGKQTTGHAGGAAAPAGGGPVTPEHCIAEACKAKAARFGFCAPHLDQYKFGLIRKDGKPADDYDKKLTHYQDYVARRGGARKVA